MTERSTAGGVARSGAPDPLLGRTINDRFKITALIARGGMGKVYRAEQTPLGRLCALKVLNPNYTGDHDPEFHRRFFLEASVAAKLTHPNTVTIFDYGKTDDDIYYMAMELLEGKTLHRALREQGPFQEERAAHIARQICRSLREAHQLDVIHRDLKPANVFLVQHGDEADHVKVLDFGLVKNVSEASSDEPPVTQTGLFMGSPKYMAPEQIKGDRVDARTDIYSLGIIMYEMLTGKVPFDRPNSVNILMAHVNEDVPAMRAMNPETNLTPAMEELILRCLAKNPDDRFASMDELLRSLKQILPSSTGTVSLDFRMQPDASASVPIVRPVLAPPPVSSGPPPRTGPTPGVLASAPWPSQGPAPTPDFRARSGSGPAVAVAILAVGAVAAGLVFVFMRSRTPEPAARATTSQAVATTAATAPPAAPSASQGALELQLAKVRVTSDPDGASVKEDGVEVCNSTPCDLLYKGPEADTSREHRVTLARAGFRSETRTFRVGDGPVTVKMTRAPAAATPRPQPPAAKPDPETPKGFKDIPY